MPKKNSYITVTDQFCGAGGSSQGVRNLSKKVGGGIEVKLALNHWKLAIETHNTNFPDTLHDCTDISACDPRRYQSTDILITSPECTNHSLAKGVKIAKKQIDMFNTGKADAAAERSRATMWDVCRFAEYHSYNCVIVENVVDARKWVMFDAWLQAMYLLGYLHKCVYLNSRHFHPTPQSRDRMYIVFWKKENKAPALDYTPTAHCQQCGKDVQAVQTWKNPDKKFGKYQTQYVYKCPVHGITVEPYYYASFNCIDWSDIGTRIGDRTRDLSPNSKKRIITGLEKFGSQNFLIHTSYGKEARGVERAVTEPFFTQTTFPSQALISPFIINDQHSTGIDYRVKSVTEPIQGITTTPHFKLVMPFIVKGEHTKTSPSVRSVTDAMQTQVTRQSMGLVTPPIIIENKKTSSARSAFSPLSCATSVPYHGILTTESWNSFIHYNRKQPVTHVSEPVGTIGTVEQNSLITYKEPKYEDCYYRMIKAPEVKLAMAFDKDYKILGTSKEQVKQCGNAVTPPAMEWLVKQCVESLN